MIKLKRVPALGTVYLKNTISPACSIHQRPRINISAPRDQFQRIQVIAEQRRWLFATIRHYSLLFVTIRHYSSLFALFVLFAIHYSRLFAVRYSWLFAIRYSGFPDTPRGTLTWKFQQQNVVIYFFASSEKLTIYRKTNLRFSFLLMDMTSYPWAS